LAAVVDLLARSAVVAGDDAVAAAELEATRSRADRLAALLERVERRVAKRRAESVSLDGDVFEEQTRDAGAYGAAG
jgi:hypothetical protein